MGVQVEIEFDQLVKLAKKLPARQWSRLKKEVENEVEENKNASKLKALLLNAPTFSKRQLDEIVKTRKAINKWRTK